MMVLAGMGSVAWTALPVGGFVRGGAHFVSFFTEGKVFFLGDVFLKMRRWGLTKKGHLWGYRAPLPGLLCGLEGFEGGFLVLGGWIVRFAF